MWTLLLVIVLVPVGLLFLLALALVLPIRVRVALQGDNHLDRAEANVRLYGGLLGLGVRVDRGTYGSPRRPTIVVGPVLWRWLVPVKRLGPTEHEPERPPRGEGEAKAPQVAAPKAAAREQPAPAETRSQAEGPAAAEAFRAPAHEAPAGEGPPEHESEEFFSGELPPDREAPAPGGSRWRELRALWDEWSPIGRGALHRLRGVIRLRAFHVEGAIGLNDPALTGQFVGWISTLRALEGRALRIRVAGDFERAAVRGTFRAEWRISPIRIWISGLYVGRGIYRRWRRHRREAVRHRGGNKKT